MIGLPKTAVLAAGMLIGLSVAQGAEAAPLIVNSGDFYTTGDGESSGRAHGIRADSSFTISSLGIWGDLSAQSYEVVIFSSPDGATAGGSLASATAAVGGSGNGWNTIPIDFSFDAGSFYVVHWRPSVFSEDWATTLDYYWDSALPRTLGPLTLIEGIDDWDASDSANSTNVSLRYQIEAIPEPGALLLVAMGASAILLRRHRSRS